MINRDEFLTELKEEQRFRKVLRKLLEGYMKEKKQTQLLEEQRIRKVIRVLIKESKTELLNEKEEVVPHASTGINELEVILQAIKDTSKQAYKRLTTSPDQRKAFISTWKWLFKAAFSEDMKLRNAAEAAAEKIDKNGFETSAGAADELIQEQEVPEKQEVEEEEEDDEQFTMKITDPKLQTAEPEEEVQEPTEEEEHDFKVSELITSLDDVDRAGPRAAAKLYNATRKQVMAEFDQLSGEDAENFYKWFFINMLGTKLAGFEGDPEIKPLTGHFQYAEAALQKLGIDSDPELLPIEDADVFNIPSNEF